MRIGSILLGLVVFACDGVPREAELRPTRTRKTQGALRETAPPASTSDTPAAETGPFYAPEPEGRPTVILRSDAPNMRYAAMDGATCEAELTKRGAPVAKGELTAGVLAPTRLTGSLRGVSVHSGLSATQAAKSSSTIFDCRLLLALDDFAVLASKKGIVEMVYFGAYRSQAAFGCTPKYAGMQHCAALAVDVATFKHSDGTVLSVEKDFHGHVGNPTCGPTARPLPASSAELWGLVCGAADEGIFNVILTPNYNAQHFNHFHLEITPDAAWMLIH